MYRGVFCIISVLIINLFNFTHCVYAAGKVRKIVFNNGLTLLHKESKTNDIVAMNLFIKAGSWYEKDSNSGITNLVQQMLLKGTITRTAEDIAYQMDSMGGIIDTRTSEDYAEIYTIVTKRHFEKGFEILFDVVENAIFPNKEIEKEKNIILSQIKAKEDNIFDCSHDLLNKTLYGSHPYGKPVLGTKETVKLFNREVVVDFHKKFYTPDNMVLVIVGNVAKKKAVKKVKKIFSGLYTKSTGKKEVIAKLPGRDLPCEKSLIRQFRQAYIMLGYISPGVRDKNYVVLKVINTLLGRGMNSRLFTNLRDKEGLAYEIGSFYPTRKNASRFVIYAGLDEKNLVSIKEKILEEIEQLKKGLISVEELEGAKNYLKGSFIIDHQTNKKQAWFLGWFELLGISYNYDRRYLRQIEKVTSRDIKEVANSYFKDNNWVMIQLKPEK